MILVDTSVWIEHLRKGSTVLSARLDEGQVLMHPFIIGELACGNLKNRAAVLRLLRDLPATPLASDPEVLGFIDRRKLMGRGIGYIDAHLLASVALTGTARLWTHDKRLAAVAAELKLAVKQ
jgi:hypothetical protein